VREPIKIYKNAGFFFGFSFNSKLFRTFAAQFLEYRNDGNKESIALQWRQRGSLTRP
jgi:hypothetical protein